MNTLEVAKLDKMEQAVYDALLSELGFTDKQLSEKQEDELIILARHVYKGEADFANYPAKEMYDLVRRLECGDVPWLKLWKRYYENEQDESVKFSMLKWGVCSLVQEDMRAFPFSTEFSNARQTFSEIHEDYARVLGVSVEDVFSAIDALLREHFLRRILNGFYGVSYVPLRMYKNLNLWEYE